MTYITEGTIGLGNQGKKSLIYIRAKKRTPIYHKICAGVHFW